LKRTAKEKAARLKPTKIEWDLNGTDGQRVLWVEGGKEEGRRPVLDTGWFGKMTDGCKETRQGCGGKYNEELGPMETNNQRKGRRQGRRVEQMKVTLIKKITHQGKNESAPTE